MQTLNKQEQTASTSSIANLLSQHLIPSQNTHIAF